MNLSKINDLPKTLQIIILYLSDPNASYQKIGDTFDISKQAVERHVKKGLIFFKLFDEFLKIPQVFKQLEEANALNEERQNIINHLRLELILKGAKIYILECLVSRIKKFFPDFKLGRLKAFEKEKILNIYSKYQRAKGKLEDFCKVIERSKETILRWKKLYERLGVNGLADKTTVPKYFGNSISPKIRQYLLSLFISFPNWTEFQYHKYLRHNPYTQYYVSLPTIRKLKREHKNLSEQEKARIKKRWCFEPGTDVWTIDFTVIVKTNRYTLYLLTVSDTRSRFLFKTALFLETSTALVMDHLEELFIKYGKPKIIKADNGPEFRIDFKNDLEQLCVYLLNNPIYYGQFNGAHERIHRTIKTYLSAFETHCNLTRLVEEINRFENEYNHEMCLEYLGNKTPSEIYFDNKAFVPQNCEIVTPYEKNGELRMKFTNRHGGCARISMPIIEQKTQNQDKQI